tara:strand:+ start:475 stop:1308 length:834 start_codon:yes stop_codon:yes gene_type:complete
MFNVTINKKKYVINTNFNEITIKELHKGYEFLQIAPVEVLNYLKPIDKDSDKPEPERTINASVFLDFQIHWISLFSNIPKDVLKMVQPTGLGIMSIEHVFSFVKSFMYTPEEYYDVKTFEFHEKKYDLVEELETISGAKIYFSEGTFNQFKLSNMLTSQIQGEKKPSTTEGLVQLMAVLYTCEGDNSNEAINEKVKLFWELDASTCYSSYFFFAKSVPKWKDFFNSYTEKTTRQKHRKAVKLVLKDLLRSKFKNSVIGKLLKLKLQNSAFSIMDWKA